MAKYETTLVSICSVHLVVYSISSTEAQLNLVLSAAHEGDPKAAVKGGKTCFTSKHKLLEQRVWERIFLEKKITLRPSFSLALNSSRKILAFNLSQISLSSATNDRFYSIRSSGYCSISIRDPLSLFLLILLALQFQHSLRANYLFPVVWNMVFDFYMHVPQNPCKRMHCLKLRYHSMLNICTAFFPFLK